MKIKEIRIGDWGFEKLQRGRRERGGVLVFSNGENAWALDLLSARRDVGPYQAEMDLSGKHARKAGNGA